MSKRGRFLVPFLCVLIPLIPLSYLYSRNADYISAVHVAVVGAAMMVVSVIGYLVLRLVFKSRFSGLVGCAVAWLMFFTLRSASLRAVEDARLFEYGTFAALYAAVTVILTLLVAFLVKRISCERLYPVFLIFLAVLLGMNAFPAVRTGLENELSDPDLSAFKMDFNVEDSVTPNVYWFHCDGMLGFEAFEKYFGDDQAAFIEALKVRGFQINRGAMLEVNHTTKYAVAALLSPYFYDSTMHEALKDHETAVKQARRILRKGMLNYARMNAETRLAFERKGYTSQTIGNVNGYYPPVTNKVYVTADSRGAYLLETGDGFVERFQSITEAGELSNLLLGTSWKRYFDTILKLGQRDLLGFPLRRAELPHSMTREQLDAAAQGKNLPTRNRTMLEAIYDAVRTDAPTYTTIFNLTAHFPFNVDENGAPSNSDPDDIHSYPPQHRYAASMLIAMIDQILTQDPDAVIVLQGDHGLHGQSRAQITEAFGEDAVVPIWNQVISALRVPEKFKTGEEPYALKNPLNISRYLVNSFVGRNYEYVD